MLASPERVTIIARNTKKHWTQPLKAGLRVHGIEPVFHRSADLQLLSKEELDEIAAGVVIAWGWRDAGLPFRAQGTPVLNIESAFVGDRRHWLGFGWNGLKRHGQFPVINDGGRRWRRHFAHLLCPWRTRGYYILLLGQMTNDTALEGFDIQSWYEHAASVLQERFQLPIVFRPHPKELLVRQPTPVAGTRLRTMRSLKKELMNAAVAVTYNSLSAVDAVVLGVPTIVCHDQSMAWDVAAHGLDAKLVRPDRTAWCHWLSWCQWHREELADGSAWSCLREMI